MNKNNRDGKKSTAKKDCGMKGYAAGGVAKIRHEQSNKDGSPKAPKK